VGLQESVAPKTRLFALTDGSRHIAAAQLSDLVAPNQSLATVPVTPPNVRYPSISSTYPRAWSGWSRAAVPITGHASRRDLCVTAEVELTKWDC